MSSMIGHLIFQVAVMPLLEQFNCLKSYFLLLKKSDSAVFPSDSSSACGINVG